LISKAKFNSHLHKYIDELQTAEIRTKKFYIENKCNGEINFKTIMKAKYY